MVIIILKRVKDKHGNILYFDCLVNGTNQRFTFEQLKSLKDFVTNAYLKGDNFVAKSGSSIETTIDYKYNITPYDKKVVAPQQEKIDYWGSDMIDVCRKIRQCAQKNNLVVNMDSHKSNDRSNLLLCCINDLGIDVKTFVRYYLSNIHPYELSLFENNVKSKSNVANDKTKLWVGNICYKSYMVIKIHNISTSDPIVISFHESDRGGDGSQIYHDLYSKPCAVVISKFLSRSTDFAKVQFKVCRGLQEYICESYTHYFTDSLALVSYSDIDNEISKSIESRFKNLASFYYSKLIDGNDVTNDVTKLANDYRNFGFMSYGSTVLNEVLFLIEVCTSLNMKSMDSIALDIASNLILEQSDEDKIFIARYLRNKYKKFGGGKLLINILKLLG